MEGEFGDGSDVPGEDVEEASGLEGPGVDVERGLYGEEEGEVYEGV